jgi:hypothetical protein
MTETATISIPESLVCDIGTAGTFTLDGARIPANVFLHAAWSGLSRKLAIEAARHVRDGGSPNDTGSILGAYAEKLIYSGLWDSAGSRAKRAESAVTFESFRAMRAASWAKSYVTLSDKLKGKAREAVIANRKKLADKGLVPDSDNTQAKLTALYLTQPAFIDADQSAWDAKLARDAAGKLDSDMLDSLDAMPGN